MSKLFSHCSVNIGSTFKSVIIAAEGLAPSIAAVIDAADPKQAATINAITGDVTAGLSTLQSVYNSYESQPSAAGFGAVSNAATSVQANITQLEAAAKITNPATQAKVTGFTTAAVALISMVENMVAAHATQTPTAAAASVPATS
jgi:hypothetical protein